MLNDLWRGISKHPLKLAQHIFATFSMLFTLIKAVNYFVPGVKIGGAIPFIGMLLVGLIVGLRKVWKPSKIQIKIANCNTVVEVVFGDLFEQNGLRTISVNDFFDSKLGKPVSDKSLHGIFLQKCFGGHPDSFDRQLVEQLSNAVGTNVVKSEGKDIRYPIGTTALINVNSDRYLLVALAKTDPATCKASADVTMMWDALHALWQRSRIECGGHPLNLALIGSGLSGLGLPTRDLLNLIILSAITETKAKEITQCIRVVLHKDRFDDLDLRDVKLHWKE